MAADQGGRQGWLLRVVVRYDGRVMKTLLLMVMLAAVGAVGLEAKDSRPSPVVVVIVTGEPEHGPTLPPDPWVPI
jgi:hypothetical protein